MKAKTAIVASLAVCAAAVPLAQTRLDGVLLRFGGDVITNSDVRQARMLRLVETADDSDRAYVDALVNRRLMLSEIKRTPAPEPSDAAIDSRHQQWLARLGGTDVTALLGRTGFSDAAVRAWLRDDLRLQTYLDQRFNTTGDRGRDVTAWIGELRRRAGLQ